MIFDWKHNKRYDFYFYYNISYMIVCTPPVVDELKLETSDESVDRFTHRELTSTQWIKDHHHHSSSFLMHRSKASVFSLSLWSDNQRYSRATRHRIIKRKYYMTTTKKTNRKNSINKQIINNVRVNKNLQLLIKEYTPRSIHLLQLTTTTATTDKNITAC